MALETGDYIADLNTANPTATDQKSQGDDHLRLLKSTAKKTFPGFSGAVVASGTVGGTADVITITPTTALVSYVAPMLLVFEPSAANTGAVTVNVSALGAKSLKTDAGAALSAGDLVSGEPVLAAYDGTDFRLLHPTKRYIDQLAFATELPLQTGNADKYVSTDGTQAEWRTFKATAAQIRAGTNETAALTADGTYDALDEVTLTSASNSIAVDLGAMINGYHEFTENTTLANPTNGRTGQSGYILFKQHASAAKTLGFGTNWWRVGGDATITSTTGAYAVLSYVKTSQFVLYELLNNPTA